MDPTTPTNVEIIATETSRNEIGDDLQKTGKQQTLAPEILPTRHSSLPRTRGRTESSKSSKSKKDSPTKESGSGISEDKPPTPPPKNERSKNVTEGMSSSTAPRKEGFLSGFITALVSCCAPSTKQHDSETGRQSLRVGRGRKPCIEMESVKHDDDRPTTSTIGISPDGLDLPAKKRDTLDDNKPSVTISPDALTDKEPAPKIATPPLGPLNEDDDQEHVTMSTESEQEREKELRQNIQIQAPFPPTSDESQTDARVISPAPQISLQQTTESEDSDEEEEVPEVIRTIVDEPQPRGPFLGPVPESKRGRKCLVLDLDECLIHSTFQDSKSYDFSISLDLDKDYGLSYIYVGKRPHLDEFLEEMGRLYEIVIFTASLQRYADPVVDIIDRNRVIDHRLFRDSCTRTWDPIQRVYLPNVKNISCLGRDLKQCIIIDNNPQCYQWHAEHAVPISSWFEDHLDVELLTMIPLLKDLASDEVEDVRDVLCQAFHV